MGLHRLGVGGACYVFCGIDIESWAFTVEVDLGKELREGLWLPVVPEVDN